MSKKIGRYEVIGKLGEGAMAEVFKAHDPKMGRHLAIKVLNNKHSADERFRTRFEREARAAGGLSHPGIVTIYDIGEVAGRPFIAMELLSGKPMDVFMRKGGTLTVRQILDIARQLAEALDYAHGKGIIHRDIKPANVILDVEQNTVKIADFGIARIEDPELTRQTQTTEVLGTPQYMSPEQVMGKDLDGRSDLFSIGILLYQLLSGHKPFKADTLGTLLFRIATEDPEPLAEVAPHLPASVTNIINRLLQKDPEQRYRNSGELAEAITQVAGELDNGKGETKVTTAPKKPTKSKKEVAMEATRKQNPTPGDQVVAASSAEPAPRGKRGMVAAMLLLAIAAGAGVVWYQGQGPSTTETASVSNPPAMMADEAPAEELQVLAQSTPLEAPTKIIINEPMAESLPAPTRPGSSKPAEPAPAVAVNPTAAKPEQAPVAAQRPSAPAPAKPNPRDTKTTIATAPKPVTPKVAQPSRKPAPPKAPAPDDEPDLEYSNIADAKQAYRDEEITKAEYVAAIDAIEEARDKEIMALKQAYRKEKISKADYKKQVAAVEQKYSEPSAEEIAERNRARSKKTTDPAQAALAYPSISSAKTAYKAKQISKKEYVSAIQAIKGLRSKQIDALKQRYRSDKISKAEYKKQVREIKQKFD